MNRLVLCMFLVRIINSYAPDLSRGFFILRSGDGFGTVNRPENPAKRRKNG